VLNSPRTCFVSLLSRLGDGTAHGSQWQCHVLRRGEQRQETRGLEDPPDRSLQEDLQVRLGGTPGSGHWGLITGSDRCRCAH
jgi:hypothetical protein